MLTLNTQVYNIRARKPKEVQTRIILQFLLSNCFPVLFKEQNIIQIEAYQEDTAEHSHA